MCSEINKISGLMLNYITMLMHFVLLLLMLFVHLCFFYYK